MNNAECMNIIDKKLFKVVDTTKKNTLTYKDYHYLLKLVLFAKLHDRRTPEYHQELLEKLAYWEGERERIETEELENE